MFQSWTPFKICECWRWESQSQYFPLFLQINESSRYLPKFGNNISSTKRSYLILIQCDRVAVTVIVVVVDYPGWTGAATHDDSRLFQTDNSTNKKTQGPIDDDTLPPFRSIEAALACHNGFRLLCKCTRFFSLEWNRARLYVPWMRKERAPIAYSPRLYVQQYNLLAR